MFRYNFSEANDMPYRYFNLIAVKMILSLFDRYKISPLSDFGLKFVKL